MKRRQVMFTFLLVAWDLNYHFFTTHEIFSPHFLRIWNPSTLPSTSFATTFYWQIKNRVHWEHRRQLLHAWPMCVQSDTAGRSDQLDKVWSILSSYDLQILFLPQSWFSGKWFPYHPCSFSPVMNFDEWSSFELICRIFMSVFVICSFWCSLHVQSSPRGKYRGVHSKPGAQKTTPGLVPRRQKRLKSCRVFVTAFV